MPPKRKTARGGGGRSKRPREPSPVAQGSEEQAQKRQRINSNGAVFAAGVTDRVSSKVLGGPLLGGGDHGRDGEDDRIGVMREENARDRQVITHPDAEQVHEEDRDMEQHGAAKEGEEDSQTDDEADSPEPLPPTSTRGRGRGRGRRGRGAAGPGRTRSSPRKVIQQSHDQSSSPGSHVRGRKPARGRGAVALNPLPTHVPAAAEEVSMKPRGGEPETEHEGEIRGGEAREKEGEKEREDELGVPRHPPLSRRSSPQHQFQGDHPQQQHSNPIPAAAHALQPPPATFPAHSHTYYPSYPVQSSPLQPSPFSYTYVVPPPPAPEGRQYHTLRRDGSQPMYSTSFATTVGTANGTGSASSSFSASYPASASTAQSLDANAPQGNPFPPSAPLPVPAYGTAVYSVGVSDDDDDQDQEQAHIGGPINTGKRKSQAALKTGGRTGRGDHVACHFCRGRKLKCDGRRPTCGHCALRSLACKYDDAVRRRGPGRKEKNNRRERNGANNKRTGGVVVSDLSVDPQTPTPSHSQMTSPSTEGAKRKRRPHTHANHSHQTGIIRFEDTDGTSAPTPGMKPASAAYGVDNNERLGYYYAGGPQYSAAYPQYGTFDHAANPHHHPPQAGYGYAQDGEEEGDRNAEMEGEGEGDDDREVYRSRPEESASYAHPPSESYSTAWPAEPPGGVSVSNTNTQHM